jgi:uncharacterized protein YtpQ (UPF0354 family)
LFEYERSDSMGLFGIFTRGSPKDRFAELVRQRLRERGWPYRVRYDRSRFTLDTGGDTGSLYLGNIYRDWETYPKTQRGKHLDRAVNLVFELSVDEPFEQLANKLMPVVRNLTHLQATALSSESEPSTEIWQPHRVLVAPLGVVLAIDRPTSFELVQDSKLSNWGLSFEEAVERAMDNLVPLSPVSFRLDEGGFYISDYGDAYDSSRVLMPELFPALQVAGDPVAVVVSRTCVVVAGSEETDALNAMAQFVVEVVAADSRPTSYMPIVLRNGRWEAFEPAERELASMRDLAVRQTHWDYDLQTPLLEAYLEQQGIDIFVAPLGVTNEETCPHTWTSWTADVPVRLPRAEGLGMTARDGRQMFRLWQDIEIVCGAFAEDASLHPSRFTPPEWPSDGDWQRLEREFSEPSWWTASLREG